MNEVYQTREGAVLRFIGEDEDGINYLVQCQHLKRFNDLPYGFGLDVLRDYVALAENTELMLNVGWGRT